MQRPTRTQVRTVDPAVAEILEQLRREQQPQSAFDTTPSAFVSSSAFTGAAFGGGGGGAFGPPPSAFAGPEGEDPWLKKLHDAYDARASAFEARSSAFSARMQSVRRVFLPPGRRMAPSRWFFDWGELSRCYEQDPARRVWLRGEVWDFTSDATDMAYRDHFEMDYCPYTDDPGEVIDEQGGLDCSHPPWAISIRPGEAPFEVGMTYEMLVDRNYAGDEEWHSTIRPVLLERRAELFANPERFLDDHVRRMNLALTALECADRDWNPGGVLALSHQQINSTLLDQWDDPQVRDALFFCLVDADAHYVAAETSMARYRGEEPEPLLNDYDRALAAMVKKDELYLFTPMDLQFLGFTRLRPHPEGSDVLGGTYVVTGVQLHSFLDDPGMPAGLLGWREVAMEPSDDEGEIE